MLLFPPGVYFLGDYDQYSSSTVLSIADLKNTLISGYGAELRLNTKENVTPAVLNLINPSNVTIEGLHFFDMGGDPNQKWRGMKSITLSATGPFINKTIVGGDITIRDIMAENGTTLLQAAGDPLGRLRNIRLERAHARRMYYGINFQNNGDGLTVSNFVFEDGKRAYFPYGVSDHNIEIFAYHTDTAISSETLCLIKRYNFDTKNVKLDLTYSGIHAHSNIVTLEHQNDDGAISIIENVNVTVRYRDIPISELTLETPFCLRSYPNIGGSPEAITDKIWRGIRFDLMAPDWVMLPKSAIAVTSKSTTPVDLTLGPGVQRLTQTASGVGLATPDWSGLILITGSGRIERILNGDITAAPLHVDLSKWNMGAFAFKVSIFCQDNSTSLAMQNATYCEDLIIGYNAGTGGVIVQSVTNIGKANQGRAATITYTGNREGLDITISGIPYSNSNGWAKVVIEGIGKGTP